MIAAGGGVGSSDDGDGWWYLTGAAVGAIHSKQVFDPRIVVGIKAGGGFGPESGGQPDQDAEECEAGRQNSDGEDHLGDAKSNHPTLIILVTLGRVFTMRGHICPHPGQGCGKVRFQRFIFRHLRVHAFPQHGA